jgi:hypothetical protein
VTLCDIHGDEEEWRGVPGASGYQVSSRGRFRGLDRLSTDGRRLKGKLLVGITTKDNPYPAVKYTLDTGRQTTPRPVHQIVLEAFRGPCPPGMESCHADGVPAHNCLENLRWGTKAENAADKPVNGGGPPSFPCRNAPACENMVMNEGRRCRDCVARVGRIAAGMLNAGFGLEIVTDRLGYENYDWVWKLARDFGGCTLTKRDALRQRPSLSQRVKLTLRNRRANGWGDVA